MDLAQGGRWTESELFYSAIRKIQLSTSSAKNLLTASKKNFHSVRGYEPENSIRPGYEPENSIRHKMFLWIKSIAIFLSNSTIHTDKVTKQWRK